MPRPRRIHVPGGVYHVTLRGNHRQRIFRRPSDYRLLEQLLADVSAGHNLLVHAYCWMPNHLHMALQVGQQSLARPMQKLASGFARRIQKRIPTTGHLFERRYHAVLVDSDRYLVALVRYIHLNPVRAGLAADAGSYPWSSHLAYLGAGKPRWLTTEFVLGRLARDPGEARNAYVAIMREDPPADELDVLRKGRSDRTTCAIDGYGAGQRPASQDALALQALIHEECQRLGIDPQALRDPGKDHELVAARAVIVRRASLCGLGTLGQLAAMLGRSPSSLSEGLRRVRRSRPELFVPAVDPGAQG